jgi:hypothetical protein
MTNKANPRMRFRIITIRRLVKTPNK